MTGAIKPFNPGVSIDTLPEQFQEYARQQDAASTDGANDGVLTWSEIQARSADSFVRQNSGSFNASYFLEQQIASGATLPPESEWKSASVSDLLNLISLADVQSRDEGDAAGVIRDGLQRELASRPLTELLQQLQLHDQLRASGVTSHAVQDNAFYLERALIPYQTAEEPLPEDIRAAFEDARGGEPGKTRDLATGVLRKDDRLRDEHRAAEGDPLRSTKRTLDQANALLSSDDPADNALGVVGYSVVPFEAANDVLAAAAEKATDEDGVFHNPLEGMGTT